MASGSLRIKRRPQKKRRSTNNSSNNSSSQAATALLGKVRNSCHVESGRAGRGGKASAGCASEGGIATGICCSSSMRLARARLDRHMDAGPWGQIGPSDRLNRAVRHEAEAIALRQYRDGDHDLDERERGADADMRTDRERQIGVARARGDLIRRKAVGIETVGVMPQPAVAMH